MSFFSGWFTGSSTGQGPDVSEPGEGRVFFGNRYLPADEATKHFLAVGTTGSGKTVEIGRAHV